MWSGPKLPAFSGFGTGAVNEVFVVLGSRLTSSHRLWGGLQFTKSADQYLAGIHLTPILVAVLC